MVADLESPQTPNCLLALTVLYINCKMDISALFPVFKIRVSKGNANTIMYLDAFKS